MTDTTVETGTPSNDAGTATSTDSTAVTTESTAAQTPPEGQTPPDTTTAKVEVPETYDLQMPEGVELDKEAAAEFVNIAKSLELTQENAQKLATIAATIQQKQNEAKVRQTESWVEQVKADKDLGGDKLEENLGIARKALDAFGTPELRDVLNSTGIGNHPALIKAFFKVGKAISEDKFVTGQASSGPTDPAKTMFPSLN